MNCDFVPIPGQLPQFYFVWMPILERDEGWGSKWLSEREVSPLGHLVFCLHGTGKGELGSCREEIQSLGVHQKALWHSGVPSLLSCLWWFRQEVSASFRWEARIQGEGGGSLSLSLSRPLSLESRSLMPKMGTSCSKGPQKAEISAFKTEGESEGLFLPHALLFSHLKGPKLTSEHIHSLHK